MEASQFTNIGNKDRLVDRVVSEIQDSIISGRLTPGTMLPTERDLAEQLGVSRTVVREAVHILVTKGLLETRHGVGNIVRMLGSEQLSHSLNLILRAKGFTLDNLHEVRSILEVENAGLSAANAMQEEIQDLEQVITRMSLACDDQQTFAELDAEFHHVLAKISHNPLLVMLLDSLNALMHEVRISVSHYPNLFNTVIPDHKHILECVCNHDINGARQAMQAHLVNARTIQDLFLEHWADQTSVIEK